MDWSLDALVYRRATNADRIVIIDHGADQNMDQEVVGGWDGGVGVSSRNTSEEHYWRDETDIEDRLVNKSKITDKGEKCTLGNLRRMESASIQESWTRRPS